VGDRQLFLVIGVTRISDWGMHRLESCLALVCIPLTSFTFVAFMPVHFRTKVLFYTFYTNDVEMLIKSSVTG